MKKTAVIIGPAYPLRGGLATFNERLAREFISQGYQTDIYTFSLQYPSFLFPGTTQYSDAEAPSDLNIHVCINSVNPFNWLKVGYTLMKRKPDIILLRYWLPFMGPCLGTILRLVKRNQHTQVVCLADNIIPHEKRAGDYAFTAYLIKPVDRFITMSDKVLTDLRSFTQKPAQEVIHPLYDNFGEKVSKPEAKRYLGIPEEAEVVLFFGFIRKYKGLDWLFQAIRHLKEKNYFQQHNLKFLVAGEFYEDEKPYQQLITDLDIADVVILKTNFIPDNQIRYYFSAASCVVQPYKQATQSGVTPLAINFDVPTLVTRVGSLPKYVSEKVGMLMEPNPEAIAQSIQDFFAKDITRFHEGIQQEKPKYSWKTLVDAIVKG